jgi:hypothetical protein
MNPFRLAGTRKKAMRIKESFWKIDLVYRATLRCRGRAQKCLECGCESVAEFAGGRSMQDKKDEGRHLDR